VLEVAEALGMSTGLITSKSVTDATPAAFVAHVANRSNQFAIALQTAFSDVDVLFGGGTRYFSPDTRFDSLDLLGNFRNRGCAVWLHTLHDTSPTSCAVALLAPDGLLPAPQRPIRLSVLTNTALDIIAPDPEGFFLMVEGAQIDQAAHANNGAWLLAEMRDFDAAVAVVLERLAARPNTTIIVTSDHETGGLTADAGTLPGSVIFGWNTTEHTSAAVPLFGRGSTIDRIGQEVPNFLIGRYLLDLVARPSGR